MRSAARFWLVAACSIAPLGFADEPLRRHQVVSPKDDGIIATGINSRGDVVGFEWREDPKLPGVINQDPFFARGKTQVFLPLLPTYTSTFPAAVSDTGVVVGRSSKPSSVGGRVPFQNQGFLWTEVDGIRGLGTLPIDLASFATGVSRDGSRISGLSVGDNRMTACVWDRTSGDPRPLYKATPLPQLERICSTVVAISGDGRRVAGVDGSTPALWTRSDAGAWTREAIGPAGSIIPKAVNDAGTVVGIAYPRDGSTHAMIWTQAQGVRPIPEPTGYDRSEASAINNAGAVVGMIDGPHGSPVSPRGFVFEDNRVRILEEAGPNCVGATAINDAGQVAGAFEKEDDEPAQPAKPVAPLPRPE